MVAVGEDLAFLTAAELTAAFAARRLSPVEIVRTMLERIASLDGHLHAYISVTADAALSAAQAAERRYLDGTPLGPLDGVPLGVKDVIDTAGTLTTANSRRHASRVPSADATAVARALQSGAILLGKHTTYEFAALPPDPAHPDSFSAAARNPWDSSLTTGGSSSGSAAALAAGLCTLAIATDTGGSIRNPASFCGVTGLKPSRGLVSREGVIALSRTLDCVGPMARSAQDARRLLRAFAGRDHATGMNGSQPGYVGSVDLAGLRVGIPRRFVELADGLDPETLAAYEEAISTLRALGASTAAVELPSHNHVNAAGQAILLAEAFADYVDDARDQADAYGARFWELLMQGALFSRDHLRVAHRARDLITAEAERLFETVDLVALPTTPHPAKTFEAEAAIPSWERVPFTRYFSLTGQPAISIPGGFTRSGLPLGLQLAGRFGDDALVLRAAHVFQTVTEWHLRRPVLER